MSKMPKMPGFGGFNIGKMMESVQKMAKETEKAEQELGELRIDATSGGGMVKAVVTGLGQVVEVKIDPQVVDPEDVEMLEDLVVSAVREALDKAKEAKQERMQEVAGGMGLSGMPDIPGLF